MWHYINPLDTCLSSLNFVFSSFVLQHAAAENQNHWSPLVGNASTFQLFIPLTWVLYFLIVFFYFLLFLIFLSFFPISLFFLIFLHLFFSTFSLPYDSLRHYQWLHVAPHTHTCELSTLTKTHDQTCLGHCWCWKLTGKGTICAVVKGKY
jgi:hypothetical protein